MPFRELVSGTAVEICFEFPRQFQSLKGGVKLHFPWTGFGRVRTFAGIVPGEAAF
jgi:hypothetical protein